MKIFFSIYLIFSLLLFSQQGLFTNPNLNTNDESLASDEHAHGHSVLIFAKMIFLGELEHSHDHEHGDEDFPTSSAPNHDTKSHSHFEGSHLKIDFASAKPITSPIQDETLVFVVKYIKSHFFEYDQDIFRPPISS